MIHTKHQLEWESSNVVVENTAKEIKVYFHAAQGKKFFSEIFINKTKKK